MVAWKQLIQLHFQRGHFFPLFLKIGALKRTIFSRTVSIVTKGMEQKRISSRSILSRRVGWTLNSRVVCLVS